MKVRYLDNINIYVGTAREISRLYWNFSKREIFCGSHCEFPKFNYSRMYGIIVDTDEESRRGYGIPVMHVVTTDTLVRMWEDGDFER